MQPEDERPDPDLASVPPGWRRLFAKGVLGGASALVGIVAGVVSSLRLFEDAWRARGAIGAMLKHWIFGLNGLGLYPSAYAQTQDQVDSFSDPKIVLRFLITVSLLIVLLVCVFILAGRNRPKHQTDHAYQAIHFLAGMLAGSFIHLT